MTGQDTWNQVWVHRHTWLYEFCLTVGRWKHFGFGGGSISACPSSDIPATFFLAKHWSWPEMWTLITFAYPFTSSLYFFLSLLKCFLNVALSLWLNMHSNHSAMQNIMTDCLFERQTVVPDDYSALGLHYCLVKGQEIKSRTGNRISFLN